MVTLNFIHGKATVKNGRKIVAKIFDREQFFKGTKMEGHYNKEYPFMLEMNIGGRECTSIDECIQFIEKYS